MRLEHVSRAYLEGLPALPGICADEELLIRAFLSGELMPDSTYSVDVSVPLPPRGPIGSRQNVERMWYAVTRPRIDLVVHRPSHNIVVEAKLFAKMRAATQAIQYRDLLCHANPVGRPYVPVILCASCVLGLPARMLAAGGAVLLIDVATGTIEVAG